jgi:hypothetical protein
MADQIPAFIDGDTNVSNRVIAAWLNTVNRVTYAADTITELRALTTTPDEAVTIAVRGNAAVNDGGGGFFYWNPTSTAADDGVLVLKQTSVTTGRWLRFYFSLVDSGGVPLVLNGANTEVRRSSDSSTQLLVTGPAVAVRYLITRSAIAGVNVSVETNAGDLDLKPATGIVRINGVEISTPSPTSRFVAQYFATF